mmetsp:Transcript_51112/g.145991  ORF Transcript_51112/g.145991 Transcript_51112/m.145991 type:complete len:356 (-) Transcript_51112:1797-2864(-)
MQVLQGQDQAADVEGRRGAPRAVLQEDLRPVGHHVREAPPERGLQQEVHVLRVDECLVQVNYEGAVHDGEELALPADLPLRAALRQVSFRHRLERVSLLAAHVLHQSDLAEAAPAEATPLPQILELHRLPPLLDPDGLRVVIVPALCQALAPLLDRAVRAGQLSAWRSEDLLQDLGDDDVLEHETSHSALARVHIGLGESVAAQQRSLAEMAPSAQIRQPHLLLRAVGSLFEHVLLRPSSAHDVPLARLPLLVLVQDSLPWLEVHDAVDVAGELVPLGAQERLQGMHLIEDLDVLRDLSVVMLAPPHELCPGDGEEYAILSDPEGGLPAQVVQHRQLPEAVPGHQDGHLVLRLRV